MIKLAATQDCLNEHGEALLRAIELINFVNDYDIVAFLATLGLPKFLLRGVFFAQLNKPTECFGNMEGKFLIVECLATHALNFDPSFLLSHLLKETEPKTFDICKSHRVEHKELEFVDFAFRGGASQLGEDLVQGRRFSCARVAAEVNQP